DDMSPIPSRANVDPYNSPMANLQIVSAPSLAIALVFAGLGVVSGAVIQNIFLMVVFFVIGIYFLFAIKVANQWEKCAVLRFGKFNGMRGPGLFHMIPIVDS